MVNNATAKPGQDTILSFLSDRLVSLLPLLVLEGSILYPPYPYCRNCHSSFCLVVVVLVVVVVGGILRSKVSKAVAVKVVVVVVVGGVVVVLVVVVL